MILDNFCRFAYHALFKDQKYRYSIIYNGKDDIVVGMLQWTGYDAISLLNEVITKVGYVRSTMILGPRLRHAIMNPYREWDVIKSCKKIPVDDIMKISRLLDTWEGHIIQDRRAIQEIKNHAQRFMMVNKIKNYGILTLMVSEYIDWIPGVSDEIIAICNMYGTGDNTVLINLEDKFNYPFNHTISGIKHKHTFMKITSLVDNTITM